MFLTSLILSSSVILINSVLSFEVSPRKITIDVLGTLKSLERYSIRHLFALPSTGGAVILTLTLSEVFITSFFDAFGEILS